jgi:hypothetical protein
MRGFIAHIEAITPECTSSHLQALAVKKIPSTLKTVLYEVVKILSL